MTERGNPICRFDIIQNKKECVDFDPSSIAIVTSTFYRDWYPGDIRLDETETIDDKVRGDLALKSAELAKNRNYQIVVVDGSNNNSFKNALRSIGVDPSREKSENMSPARQQGFYEASALRGVEVICWTEPEKLSLVKHVPLVVQPLIADSADIVIPRRNTKLFSRNYPDYQFRSEMNANNRFRGLLIRAGLMSRNSPEFDLFFGPKLFKNDRKLLEIFTTKHEVDTNFDKPYKNLIIPQMWPDAIFLPIVTALKNGYRIAGVEIPYVHPNIQKMIESNNESYWQKRRHQHNGILVTTHEHIKSLGLFGDGESALKTIVE